MKVIEQDPPRVFRTGGGGRGEIWGCARIHLAPDEQVTFSTQSGAEYDVVRKSWGFYATPSLNGHLLKSGLRAALIRSLVGKYYVILVETGHEAEVDTYLRAEDNVLVRWLDNAEDLADLTTRGFDATIRANDLHCMCRAERFTTVQTYFEPPAGEVPSRLRAPRTYRREAFQCALCGHFISTHQMGGARFYEGEYCDVTYGNLAGIRHQFNRIVSLPPDQSDNAGRVRRVLAFADAYLRPLSVTRSVLDVGSGLCVFLSAMKAAGWTCTALDPDARAVQHARETVGVNAILADFFEAKNLGQYDLVTFNKVLEHVKDPSAMLAGAAICLNPGGFVYVEVPDGEAAAAEGFGREEFFIEHFHVFSALSLALLAANAGFDVLTIERLREPSTKFTLRAFLRPRAGDLLQKK